MDGWLFPLGLALVVGAALRVQAWNRTAAYLLYTAGGLAVAASCLCGGLGDVGDAVLPYDAHDAAETTRSAVMIVVDVVTAALMLAGIAMAARSLPREGAS